MKHCIAFIVFLLVSFHSLGNGFMISKNQKYIIYIKQDSPKLIHYAANEMADYLAQTTGALCKVKGVGRCANNQLVVKVEGENTLAFLSNTLKASAYDEYMIQIDDSGLTIEGGNARGYCMESMLFSKISYNVDGIPRKFEIFHFRELLV